MNAKEVWKYHLTPGINRFLMPAGAKTLTVQAQFGSPQLWALVTPENIHEDRQFIVVETGEPTIADIKAYVGTFQIDGELPTFHVFEVIP